ncbi:hypothetical protein LTR09_002590 [Extremus antarcticus]|uniref:Protein-serine/threonine kinase n=1 Tax=Extremus antarcticus TaxID=702011 RepID=A0AAJ0LVD9_9PEZI|nr:hypothetical protein LTR09_002590 [Extremus antarcticus]
MLSLRTAARHNGVATTTTLPRPTSAIFGPHVPHLALDARGARFGTRHLQTATVTDADIARLAAKPLHPLTLADLCKNGRPPLSTQSLLSNANFTLSILPSRLAHRIQSLRSLPYIVVANPNVNKIHNNYVHSLSTLLPYAERKIETLDEEIKFTEAMADLVQTHSNTIAILAKGFLEARKYISAEEVTKFLDEHLRARIGTRLIAEQHIALHMSSKPHNQLTDRDWHDHSESSFIGVIDTELKPAALVRSCENTVGEICELKYGVRPTIRIVGSPDATIAHIPMHIEYVLTELLKNSFRATIEAGMEKEAIEVTIAPSPPPEETSSSKPLSIDPATHTPATISTHDQGAVDLAASSSHKPTSSTSPNIRPLPSSTPGVTIRIRDRGGGIDPANLAKLWEYGFTTFNEDEIHDKTSGGGGGMAGLDVISAGAGAGSELAGLGYGLPLGRAYAEYFGGGIAVQSLWGWGTDVYLGLRGVGRVE